MTNVMGSRFSEAIMTTGSLCMLVVAMAAIDERVRGFLTSVFTASPSNELAQAGVRAYRAARMVMDTADAHVGDPTPFVFFVIASVILTTFMLRS